MEILCIHKYFTHPMEKSAKIYYIIRFEIFSVEILIIFFFFFYKSWQVWGPNSLSSSSASLVFFFFTFTFIWTESFKDCRKLFQFCYLNDVIGNVIIIVIISSDDDDEDTRNPLILIYHRWSWCKISKLEVNLKINHNEVCLSCIINWLFS